MGYYKMYDIDITIIIIKSCKIYYYRKQLFEMISLIPIKYDDLGLNTLDIKGKANIVVLYNMVCFVVGLELYDCIHLGVS